MVKCFLLDFGLWSIELKYWYETGTTAAIKKFNLIKEEPENGELTMRL